MPVTNIEPSQFDTFMTATIKNYDTQLQKNFLKYRPAVSLLFDQFSHKDTQGGRYWQGIAEWGSNQSVKFFTGADTFSQEVTQTALPIQYEWKYMGASFSFTKPESLENRGQSALFDIAESRLRQVLRSMNTIIGQQIYSDGTMYGGKSFIGLAAGISTTPTTGTVGGINSATYSFWQNGARTSCGSFAANGVKGSATDYVFEAWNNATDGQMDEPKWIISSQDVFQFYNQTLLGTVRYLEPRKTGDLSWSALEYQGKPWYWDRQCPSGRLYGINTDYLHFYVDPAFLFDWSEPKSYPNQFAFTRLCGTRFFLCHKARMFQFVLDGWTA